MKATIDIEHAVLDALGITAEQLQSAASYALGNLQNQDTGEPIYFNGVHVTVVADCPELPHAQKR